MAAPGPLVDCHFHLWCPGMPMIREAWTNDLPDARIERLIEMLDRHGVLFGVVAAASMFGSYNDYVREALRRHRRLRATAIVDPGIGVHELKRMNEEGFVGVRLVWAHREAVPDLQSDEYRRLLRRVADLGWIVHFIEREDRTGPLIEALEHAGISRIVVDHFGHFETGTERSGDAFKAVLAAVERGRTWVKLSNGFRFDRKLAAIYVAQLVRVGGGERLVWGSDWPFVAAKDGVSYAETIADFHAWASTAELAHKIGVRTPLELYFA